MTESEVVGEQLEFKVIDAVEVLLTGVLVVGEGGGLAATGLVLLVLANGEAGGEEFGGVGGGISIKNIGGVFIVIFGGIILALLTLLIEFFILKIGNAIGCKKCSFTSEEETRVQGYRKEN